MSRNKTERTMTLPVARRTSDEIESLAHDLRMAVAQLEVECELATDHLCSGGSVPNDILQVARFKVEAVQRIAKRNLAMIDTRLRKLPTWEV